MHDWLDGLNKKRWLVEQMKIPSIKVTAVGREEAERMRLRDGEEIDTVKVLIKIWSANAVLMTRRVKSKPNLHGEVNTLRSQKDSL